MTKSHLSLPTGGTKKRHLSDREKKEKTDRERFRRARLAVIKKSHQFFIDGTREQRNRRVYVCIYDANTKGQGKYITYNSHKNETWLPSEGHDSISTNYTPEDFPGERCKPKNLMGITPPPTLAEILGKHLLSDITEMEEDGDL